MSLSRNKDWICRPGKIVVRKYGDKWGFLYMGKLNLFTTQYAAKEAVWSLQRLFRTIR